MESRAGQLRMTESYTGDRKANRLKDHTKDDMTHDTHAKARDPIWSAVPSRRRTLVRRRAVSSTRSRVSERTVLTRQAKIKKHQPMRASHHRRLHARKTPCKIWPNWPIWYENLPALRAVPLPGLRGQDDGSKTTSLPSGRYMRLARIIIHSIR
jgi:hypothetical protein